MPSARGKAIRDRDIELRDSVFEDAAERLWDRNRFHGFTTMPKTMPYICRILDELSKGQPLSTTYIALWCATWDNAFVRLGRMPDLAFAAGFSGQRGVRTFHDRLKRLVELGFVEVAPSGAQALGLVFLPNPHAVIVSLYRAKVSADGDPELKLKAAGLQAATYNAFIERAQEIGATDVASSLRALREPKRAKKAKPKPRLKPSAPVDGLDELYDLDDEAAEPAPSEPIPAKRAVRAKPRAKSARA